MGRHHGQGGHDRRGPHRPQPPSTRWVPRCPRATGSSAGGGELIRAPSIDIAEVGGREVGSIALFGPGRRFCGCGPAQQRRGRAGTGLLPAGRDRADAHRRQCGAGLYPPRGPGRRRGVDRHGGCAAGGTRPHCRAPRTGFAAGGRRHPPHCQCPHHAGIAGRVHRAGAGSTRLRSDGFLEGPAPSTPQA